jgi:hypothetical protein
MFFTAAIAGAVAVTATPARSQNFMHGSFCTGATAADRGALLFNHFHAANDDATSARALMCPFIFSDIGPVGASAGAYNMYYFDRNSTQSLSCRMEVTDINGVVAATPERHSCATAGGCASADPLFASSSSKALRLSLNVAGLPAFMKQSFRCSVPAKTASGVSGISDYFGTNN